MRVSVVATGIDDEAIITQQTVVEPARRAAETTPRRPVVPPREPPPRPIREPAYDEPRPSFANDEEEPVRRPAAQTPPAKSGGGFSMFGWKKPEASRDEDPREFNLDAPDPAPVSHRAQDDLARDPSLDEELEIPAFLRRQMNPR